MHLITLKQYIFFKKILIHQVHRFETFPPLKHNSKFMLSSLERNKSSFSEIASHKNQ